MCVSSWWLESVWPKSPWQPEDTRLKGSSLRGDVIMLQKNDFEAQLSPSTSHLEKVNLAETAFLFLVIDACDRQRGGTETENVA